MIYRSSVAALLLASSSAPAALIIVNMPGQTNSITFSTAPTEPNLHLIFEGTPASLANSIVFSYSSAFQLNENSTPLGWSSLTNTASSPTTSYTTYFYSGVIESDPAEYYDLATPVTFSLKLQATNEGAPSTTTIGVESNYAIFSPIFGLATAREFESFNFDTLPKVVAIPEPRSIALLSLCSLFPMMRRRR